MLVCY